MSIEQPRIQLRHVGHRYRRNGAPILGSVNFSVAPGDRVAILGRSGCGKSTLLQIIAGLIRPSRGAAVIDGVEVAGPSPRCTLMFQRPLLFPWLSVGENVGLALRFAGRAEEAPAHVSRLLELVGLEGLAKSRVHELSGGQQQRVALARSLAVEPNILLLDEPFSALDAVTRSELRDQIRAILDALSITFVLVTHDVGDALDLARRVVVMAPAPGRLVEDIRLPEIGSEAGKLELRTRLIASLEPEAARPLGLIA